MVIADTGFWLALANRRDRHHERAAEWAEVLDEPLITTWPVLTETCHLLLARLGSHGPPRLLESVARGAVRVFELREEDAGRIVGLMESYADLPMDLADASLVLLAEHLGEGRILSTDRRDFQAYRWKEREPFENLMEREP
jgi:hypothetical protein